MPTKSSPHSKGAEVYFDDMEAQADPAKLKAAALHVRDTRLGRVTDAMRDVGGAALPFVQAFWHLDITIKTAQALAQKGESEQVDINDEHPPILLDHDLAAVLRLMRVMAVGIEQIDLELGRLVRTTKEEERRRIITRATREEVAAGIVAAVRDHSNR